jgi:hypothetical protein
LAAGSGPSFFEIRSNLENIIFASNVELYSFVWDDRRRYLLIEAREKGTSPPRIWEASAQRETGFCKG